MEQYTAGRAAAERADTSYRGISARLRFAQKPGHGVPAYTRWINRGLARSVAALCASWGWSANMVSAVSAVVSLAGLLLLLLLPVAPLTGLLVAVLLAAGYVLDSADGQVARVTGTGSRAGEWLDHVIDSARTPAVHLCVAVGFIHFYGSDAWQWWLPLLYCVVSTCHFMSQILAEQLLRPTAAPSPSAPVPRGSVARSLVMLHTDTGILCWMFLIWGFAPLFLGFYLLMFAANTLTSIVSMTRKFRMLSLTERSTS
ncbi:CDP-alcohol phosphatidyltransferase [Arthrobacter psychrolactophilus]|uniref:CDP-alcohol phosphatidyltransferase n=1 Tax=Arthrobacter psychrolactophilus TaxID=92442 RepID=A0A2V5IL19_9MICC|nr:CDP-alcohol phosphatidyltransferase family protein [Arthrobacter psychrolactophilus]PYI37315.1 CDP-alcohol phosphatidyltransferase [Arthrobacter psychrolactophilus]